MTFCPMLCHTLNRLVDVIYVFLVDPLLHYSPDLIIHGVHIRAVWGPLVGRNKVWHLGVKVRLCHALREYDLVVYLHT